MPGDIRVHILENSAVQATDRYTKSCHWLNVEKLIGLNRTIFRSIFNPQLAVNLSWENYCDRFSRTQMKEYLTTEWSFEKGVHAIESIDSYIRRFNQTAKALTMQEEDKVSIFIRKLTGDLQEHLITLYPSTLLEAFELARVKAQAISRNKQRIDQKNINNINNTLG